VLRNYIKVAIRNLSRNKVYSLINIFGLTLGISIFTLLWLFVNHELGYNSYHSNYDRIYRIYEERTDGGGERVTEGFTSMVLTSALEADYPQVEKKVNLFSMGHTSITVGERSYFERDYLMADPSIFEVFDFDLIDGSFVKETAEMAEAILTESTALKYFGQTDVAGKSLEVSNFGNVQVIAVIKDIPTNSDLQADIIYICDFTKWPDNWANFFKSWDRANTYSFLLFAENASPEDVLVTKQEFLKKYLGEKWQTRDFFFQPLSDLHLRSMHIEDFDRLQLSKGNIQYIYIFSAIGLFVLLIASINYINLATARSFERLKEVGVRKVVGATRRQLISQFLSESIVISFISVIVAVGLIEFILPFFNSISNKNLSLNFIQQPQLLLFFFLLAVLIGLISGLTPAWLISGFKAINIFRGGARQKGRLITRKGLVVLQFAISMIMIVATVVVYLQMEYVKSAPLGFDKDQMLIIDINSGEVRRGYKAMKTEFLNHPDVHEVSVASRVPGEWKRIAAVDVAATPTAIKEENVNMSFMAFDEDALETFDFEIVEGRYFTGITTTDSLTVILNSKAVKALGLKEPLGSQIRVTIRNREYHPRVVGIIKDFHFQSLYEEIGPMVVGFRQNPIQVIDYFALKISGNNLEETVAHVTGVHNQFDTNNTIEFHFLDEQLDRFYKNDERRGEIFGLAAGLAILIACLGLFGLASFTAQQRTKEFGIRKVLGASVSQIIMLLTKEYVVLVLVAFVVAVPFAWYFMQQWLNDFAYRIDLSFGIFLAAGLTSFLIAIMTVSYRSLRAAKANPVDSLRYE